MKKKYTSLEMEITVFETADVIDSSDATKNINTGDYGTEFMEFPE